MSLEARHQTPNERYLTAALGWLRLRLEWHAAVQRPPVIYVPESIPARTEPRPESPSLRRWLGWGMPSPPPEPAVALPPPSAQAATEARIVDATVALEAAEAGEPRPALLQLADLLDLSRFERHALLLCAAIELDSGIAELCARAQGDPKLNYPTFALALALFEDDDPAWDARSPHRRLRYWRLIEINQPSGQPLNTSALRADERIVNHIKGLNELDDRLEPLLEPLELGPDEVGLPPSQRAVVDRLLHRWRQTPDGVSLPLAQLVGPDAASKQLVAIHAAARLGRQLYRLPVGLLPTHAADLETLARLWHRESLLLPLALYLNADDTLDAPDLEDSGPTGPGPALGRFLARSDGVFVLGSRERRAGVGRPDFALDVDRPTRTEQRDAWAAVLGPPADDLPNALTSQFNLNGAVIRAVGERVLAETEPGDSALGARLWDACLESTRPQLEALAQRLELRYEWDDLVLPPAELRLIEQIAGQVLQRTKVYETWGFGDKMSRGLGISALFTGPSGTGKTMAAEVLANALRLNLYRIDLSAVVSKFIGQTEKRLRVVFDGCEQGGALLFFDEADALFGKRSEVKDSHDRYANIEINYLLQRMEAYRGLAILATNMKSALDPAFLRRLRFIVTFPFPALSERRRIWERVFPPPERMPRGRLDLDRLARLPATGGMIHNIALNAAFMAAQAETEVSMPLVLEAARSEFRKLDQPMPDSDFTWSEPPEADARVPAGAAP